MGQEALRGFGREGLERMMEVMREGVVGMLGIVGEVYGRVEGYLREMCGLDDEDIEKIRERLSRRKSLM